MSSVQLPRPLESYFVIVEMPGTGGDRVFQAVLPYRSLHTIEQRCHQWRVSADEDAGIGEEALEERRQQEIMRFERDIEQWLGQSKQMLVGDDSIPVLAPIEDGA